MELVTILFYFIVFYIILETRFIKSDTVYYRRVPRSFDRRCF